MYVLPRWLLILLDHLLWTSFAGTPGCCHNIGTFGFYNKLQIWEHFIISVRIFLLVYLIRFGIQKHGRINFISNMSLIWNFPGMMNFLTSIFYTFHNLEIENFVKKNNLISILKETIWTGLLQIVLSMLLSPCIFFLFHRICFSPLWTLNKLWLWTFTGLW